MKKPIRIVVIHILALYLASQVAQGMVFSPDTEGLIATGAVLGLASFTIRPIIKILLLPISLATMGVFGFFANVITLYVIDLALPQFEVVGFNFQGGSVSGVNLPHLEYTGFVSYIAFAVVISVINSLINWLRK